MNPKVTEIIDKIESATIRERALVLLSCVAVVYLLWDFILYSPLANAKEKLNRELVSNKESISTLRKEEKALMLALSNDPDRELRTLLDSMEKRNKELEEGLDSLSGRLVKVEHLSLILQDVLKKTNQLTLESLHTLPVEKLDISQDNTIENQQLENQSGEANSTAFVNAGVYKHGVLLIVKGTYFQTLDYLKQLEKMPSRFYWDELRYEQDSYPNGYFYLKVYTLTTSEGLSGV